MPSPVRKVLITGVESTGKSTLAAALAAHYQTVWVREYAREYLENLQRNYRQADLTKIAEGQIAREAAAVKNANDYLFCDTGMLVLKIWSIYKYGSCDPFILDQLAKRDYVAYVLCSPQGIEWEYDPLREAPTASERQKLHRIYQRELRRWIGHFNEVTGDLTTRKQQVIQQLSK